MKKLLFLISLIIFSCSKEKNEPTNYVILIVGQSNTHAGIGYDLELDKTVDGIKQLGRFGNDNMKIIDANEPLHNHTASENKIGFGLTFQNF